MENLLHNSPETEAIRQRMEEVRCDLDEDVQEIVEGARDMGDWRSYVRTYPWICLGAALAVGYLIVPGRTWGTQPDARHLPTQQIRFACWRRCVGQRSALRAACCWRLWANW